MEIVKKSQAGGGVAVKIEHAVYESAKMFGRHFDEKDELVSQITRQSIDVLKVRVKFNLHARRSQFLSRNPSNLMSQMKNGYSLRHLNLCVSFLHCRIANLLTRPIHSALEYHKQFSTLNHIYIYQFMFRFLRSYFSTYSEAYTHTKRCGMFEIYNKALSSGSITGLCTIDEAPTRNIKNPRM